VKEGNSFLGAAMLAEKNARQKNKRAVNVMQGKIRSLEPCRKGPSLGPLPNVQEGETRSQALVLKRIEGFTVLRP